MIVLEAPAQQSLPVTDNNLAGRYSFISPVYNRVLNDDALDSLYKKLYTLQTTGQGRVSIVHIGDSHVQGDFLSAIVRNNLQYHFGNAGRGLIFPYRLAKSNPPEDLLGSSPIAWQYNRVAHPEISLAPGISGYVARTTAAAPSIDIALKPNAAGEQTFNRLKLFTGDDPGITWMIYAANNNTPVLVKKEADSLAYIPVSLDVATSSFRMDALASAAPKELYGISLENDSTGILLHTIGVNGARYDQYNIAPLFWKQLPALNADLYIISMGTNEAQRAKFDGPAFGQQVSLLIQKLKKVSPKAAILITTAADSYKGRGSNAVLRQLNFYLSDYCMRQRLPLWDMYRATGGYGAAFRWIQKGLMNRDRIHFTVGGYQLQGELLWNALAKGYNSYLELMKLKR